MRSRECLLVADLGGIKIRYPHSLYYPFSPPLYVAWVEDGQPIIQPKVCAPFGVTCGLLESMAHHSEVADLGT